MQVVDAAQLPSLRSGSRRRGWMALLCVLALHLVFLALLSRPTALRQAPPMPVSVTMRLFPLAEPPPERPTPRERAEPDKSRQPAAITQAIVPPARTRVPAKPGALGDPGATAATAAITPAHAAPPPEMPASQPPRPLDLTLPRGISQRPDARNPAVDDPLANTARLTPEERMARAFDQRETEERLGDGSVRLRRGADCVIVTPARTSQLFPTDPSAARVPGTAHGCQ